MNRAKLIDKMDAKIRFLGCVDRWAEERTRRIRSIIRRLKRCNECLRGKIPELEERGRPWMEYQVIVWEDCPRCNGTGQIA